MHGRPEEDPGPRRRSGCLHSVGVASSVRRAGSMAENMPPGFKLPPQVTARLGKRERPSGGQPRDFKAGISLK
jgi:hypothetical protein